jgi:putative membrane protein
MMGWQQFGQACGRGFGGGGHPWGMMLFGFLFFLLVIGLVTWAIVALVRHGKRGAPPATGSAGVLPKAEDALEVARLRYARGEITREEYVALRDDLK